MQYVNTDVRSLESQVMFLEQIDKPSSRDVYANSKNSIEGHPHLPSCSWYFIASVTLSVLNRPDEIPAVFKYALEKGGQKVSTKPSHDEQLKIARQMREALVKTAPIGGLPKV